jgi:hypothetical protein
MGNATDLNDYMLWEFLSSWLCAIWGIYDRDC